MPKPRSRPELPEQLMTVDQVCAYLSMDESTLRRHRRNGLFPAPDVWISERYPRWSKATIAAYLANPPSLSGVTLRDRAQSIRRQRAKESA
jgi:predicted DNA-binding transcriptional regulator AlpA